MKLAALALVIAALGLPLNDLPRFALLVVAAVLVFTGRVSTSSRRWLAALVLAAVCLLAQMTLPFPRIEEGHNVFLVDRPGGALEAGLPPQAFRRMLAEFDARYPPAQRCDPKADGCWRGQGFPDRAFAFSADGMFGRAGFFAPGVGHRFRRSGLAADRVHQREPLQLELAGERCSARVARPPRLGAAAPLAPRDAVVRDVPLPGGITSAARCAGAARCCGRARTGSSRRSSTPTWHAGRSPRTMSDGASSASRSATNRRSPCGSIRPRKCGRGRCWKLRCR